MSASLSRRFFVQSATAGSVAAALPAATRAQEATPAATPASTGVTPDRVAAAIDRIPELAHALLDRTGVPGLAVGVVHQDEVRYVGGFGVREVGTNAAVDADTVFQIASVSKPVSSTIVAAVVGDGDITWDTKVADLDPAFALADPWVTANVTLADLFSHRSGLPDHAGDPLEDLGGTREEVLHRLRYMELDGAFRASYAYTNFGLTEAAIAAAMSTGTVWEDLADQRLFGPLGMTRSSFRYSDFEAQENRSLGHVQRDGAWVHLQQRQPDAQSPAGGASSTVRDLSQWLRLQLGNGAFEDTQVVDAAALAATHTPQALPKPPADPGTVPGFYGLGWNVNYATFGETAFSHSGAFALGAATCVYVVPGSQLGVVVLTNGEPIGIPEALAVSILDLCHTGAVQNDYFALFTEFLKADLAPQYGADVATPPAQVEPPSDSDAYAGTYANDVYGDLVITAEGDALTMHLGPNQTPFPLTHYTRDVFTYQPAGENAGPASAVTFTLAADGHATRVVIEILNLDNAGVFTRET